MIGVMEERGDGQLRNHNQAEVAAMRTKSVPVRGRFGLRTDDNTGTEKGFDDQSSFLRCGMHPWAAISWSVRAVSSNMAA